MANCVAATPNTLAACVCQTVALHEVGPVGFVTDIDAGAFSADTFYWSQYYSFARTSDIVAGPIGHEGEVLIHRIDDSVHRLRITQDKIFVEGYYDLYAFSLSGVPLPTPEASVAFPVVKSQVTSTDMGLFLGLQQLSPQASSYAETDVGVYYVSFAAPYSVQFVAFDQPGTSRTVAFVSGPAAGFAHIWVSGSNLYMDTVVDNVGGSHVINYADLTVIGQ